jgi:hypothetical protein
MADGSDTQKPQNKLSHLLHHQPSMPEYTTSKFGPLAVYDTGALAGRSDYKTVVVIPGLAWHAKRYILLFFEDKISS